MSSYESNQWMQEEERKHDIRISCNMLFGCYLSNRIGFNECKLNEENKFFTFRIFKLFFCKMTETQNLPTLKVPKKQELSDEDEALKEELNMLVQHLLYSDKGTHKETLEMMANHIRASTTSMTSVPKPLKFMRDHYESMKKVYSEMPDQVTSNMCADIISVLSMAMGNGDCLTYRLLQEPAQPVGDWGHEYVRHLTAEIVAKYPSASGKTRDQLIDLVRQITIYSVKNNAEIDACDLLMEIEQLPLLLEYVDDTAYQRVSIYLMTCFSYVPAPENLIVLDIAFKLSRKFKQYIESMRLALLLNDRRVLIDILQEPKDLSTRKQLAFLLARQQVCLELDESYPDFDELTDIMSNTNLNKHFLNFARGIDIMEPKTAEDIYKSHLDNAKYQSKLRIDSAKQNLSVSFVNGFINAGFGTDKLLSDDANKWIYKNKEYGMMSSAASIGLIKLWDIDSGLTMIDQYLYSADPLIKAGALLASGIINCGVRNEVDPAHAILSDYVFTQHDHVRIGAILGLGIAYAGSNRNIAIETLNKVIVEQSKKSINIEILCMATLSMGLISVGTSNGRIMKTLLEAIKRFQLADLENENMRFFWLGLGLIYLGRQRVPDEVTSALSKLVEPHRSVAKTTVLVCSFAGTGDVLKIQQMQHLCSDHYEVPGTEAEDQTYNKEKDLSAAQAIGVIGIALISMGEEIGSEMTVRLLGNHLQYSEACIRRSVPLALGLLSASNPKFNILDILSKLSHDTDNEVAQNAIFAMGLISAGTNNARFSVMLRQLAQYHNKTPENLFAVRIAQGLTHLGKGTLTLCPYHNNRLLMNHVAVAGLLTAVVAFINTKESVLISSHYLLYTLVLAMQPRMLITFDKDLNELHVPVRIGTALDVVGQAGKPKTITGFQTQTTPVLLAMNERAELASDEYLAETPILEGFVILNKNPNFVN